MTLYFTLSDGKNYKISNTTSSPMSLIYKIIDWTRGIEEFDFDFSGYGEIPDYKEKINAYLTSGYKDMIGNKNAAKYKIASLLAFTLGFIMLIALKDVLCQPGMLFSLFPFFTFIIISFIIDIVLLVDEIRDNQHRGYNG